MSICKYILVAALLLTIPHDHEKLLGGSAVSRWMSLTPTENPTLIPKPISPQRTAQTQTLGGVGCAVLG